MLNLTQKLLTQFNQIIKYKLKTLYHMTTLNQQLLKEQLENLHSHLTLIRTMKDNEKQSEFFVLLEKAQKILGDVSPHIAFFYFSYGSFLLSKIENNMDLFNPNAVPEAQEDGFVDEYDECYDDDSLNDQNGANNDNQEKRQVTPRDEEKKQKVSPVDAEKPSNEISFKKGNEKVLYEDECMQITEIDEKLKQKLQENPNFLKNHQDNGHFEEEEEDLSDIQICYENFQAALTIYQREIKKMENGEQSPLERRQALKYKFLIHGRLGELYALDQKYEESIKQFKTVIEFASDFDHPETLRNISEAHFSIGNALLHQNNAGCEKLAIQEYISSVICLIKFIHEVERYDTQKFEVPTLERPRVDRYQYLRAPKDNEMVAELKQVISMILDKIEDTYEQIGVRASYEAEKIKMEKQKQDSGFKEVPKDVKVTNLGSFGNRKRTPSQGPVNVENQTSSIMKGLNPNAPNLSLRNSVTPIEGEKSNIKANQQSGRSQIEQIVTETEVKEVVVKNQNNQEKLASQAKDSAVDNGLNH